MLYSTMTILGGLLGGVLAWRRGGNRFDIAQYTAVWAVLGFILGIFASILIARIGA